MKFDETAESSSVLDGKTREPASLAAEVDAKRGSYIASCIEECCKKSAQASRGSRCFDGSSSLKGGTAVACWVKA